MELIYLPAFGVNGLQTVMLTVDDSKFKSKLWFLLNETLYYSEKIIKSDNSTLTYYASYTFNSDAYNNMKNWTSWNRTKEWSQGCDAEGTEAWTEDKVYGWTAAACINFTGKANIDTSYWKPCDTIITDPDYLEKDKYKSLTSGLVAFSIILALLCLPLKALCYQQFYNLSQDYKAFLKQPLSDSPSYSVLRKLDDEIIDESKKRNIMVA